MTSFDVLNSSTQVFGHYFLEASAGTGKTFAIENIVPRLLLESEKPLQLEEILVVTFTRAATRELKSRIYQNLLKIRNVLDSKDEGPSYLDPFRQGSDAKLYEAKRKIEEALCSFEKAQIFTLHGFCLKILQEFAFEAKFLLSAQDEEECTQDAKLKVYIKDFLRRGIDPLVISPSQLCKVIKAQGKEIESFCDELLRLLEGGQKIRHYPNAIESLTLWNQALSSMPKVSKESLWHDFSLLAPALARSKKRKAQADAFFSWIEKKECSFEEWDALVEEKELFLDLIRFDSAYKKKGMKELGLNHPGLFEEMTACFVPLHKTAGDPRISLLVLANAAKKHYEKGRLDLAHFRPDDLVSKLQEAIQDKVFCHKLQSKYRAAIIDEFQDTDALQWNIFETLFLKTKDKLPILYLVGDPKQSIYAFRKADVYLYLRAAALLGENSVAHLDTNFRSHPALVNALNELFSFDLPERWMLLPLTGESLDVRRVKSKSIYPSSLDEEKMGRVHFFLINDEAPNEKKWPRESIEEENLFPVIAREILRLQKERGYTFAEMAILVKDRYQAVRLQKALKIVSIPCLMQKSLDVSTSVAYESMKGLLMAIERPRSLSSLKKFLGGPLMGYSSEEIEGSLENIKLQKAREYFVEASTFLRRKGFGVFFQNFLFSPSRLEKKNIAEDLLSREDPHLYFDLRQLCQILLENCPQGLYDIEALLEFLEEMKNLPSDSEALKQFSEEEEDQVQVMTLHKSKGLEFEIVFALGLSSRHVPKEEFISVRLDEGREIAVAPDTEEALNLYREELDAEKLRQLYVALTRAKERVYIPVVLSKRPQEIARGSAAPVELLLAGIGLSTYSFKEVYQKIDSYLLESLILRLENLKERASISYEVVDSFPFTKEKDLVKKLPLLIEPPTPRKPSENQFLLSFSSLIQESKAEKDPISIEKASLQNVVSFHAFPLGAETGTVIHAILEAVCKADLHRKIDDRTRKIVESFCKSSCLEGKEDDVFCMVEQVMSAPISVEGESFTLGEVPSSDMHLELEFLYPFGSSLLKGFIDLLFRFQGRYYVLDWKTNFLGPQNEDYSLENKERCMAQSGYFLQASIYASATQKYIALFEKKPFEKLFGGAIYFFVRGMTPYLFQPDFSLLESYGASLCNH